MKISGIYKITSPSGNVYIGQSIDCKKRENLYKNVHCKSQARLYNSILKYGWEAHKFEVIHICEPSELNELEVFYIQLFQSFNTEHGLNLQSGGNVKKWSDESKDKLRIKNTGKKASKETIIKLRESHLGIKLSNRAKEKLSQYWKGRVFTNAHKNKLSERRLGIKFSAETKKRISEGHKGQKAWNKGISKTKEEKEAHSLKMKKRWAEIRQERLTMIF